jgi:hypothetical protein
VVWCGVVWCGVVWCGVVWCGVVWCGVVGLTMNGAGVVPGRGPSAAPPDSRRLTLMIGFWRRIQAVTLLDGGAGAGQPYPHPGPVGKEESATSEHGGVTSACYSPRHEYTWPLEMEVVSVGKDEDESACIEVHPTYVPVVWEPVDDRITALNQDVEGGGRSAALIQAPYQSCFQGF